MATEAQVPDEVAVVGAEELVLRYSHHVIEHLGLKLYQNRPTNVIAELLSNGWDAGARAVWIDLGFDAEDAQDRYVAVADSGRGMTLAALKDSYLVIGRPKQQDKLGDRYPMGRKGIGKLAPFGIARTVDVITVTRAGDRSSATWLRLSLAAIISGAANTSPNESAMYTPEPIALDVEPSALPVDEDMTGAVAKFLSRIGDGTGTLILLTKLSINRPIEAQPIAEAMGRRFTVTLAREDFHVFIDGVRLTPESALPTFDLRIPPEGMIHDEINGRPISYWVGFVGTAQWPQDEAGIGVYAHGKIAQDRPFVFGRKGKEILTRYMYGVVQADWLASLPEDVISTDRRSVDWDHADTEALYEWGKQKVGNWTDAYLANRAKSETRRVRDRIRVLRDEGELPKISEEEEVMIADILAEITPELGKDENAEKEITGAVIKAYLHRPMRDMLKALWDKASEYGTGAPEFIKLIDQLSRRAVPEALSLAVTFAQRAYALTTLYRMKHEGREPDLQKLIERFPWILEPAMEKLNANQTLKTVVMSAVAAGLGPARSMIGPAANPSTRPDFVFLTDREEKEFVIVEIKSPQEDLTIENREQLDSYMVYLEQKFDSASIRGVLVGSGNRVKTKGPAMIVKGWDEVFRESRRIHIELLASMLAMAEPHKDDDRVQQIREFGGPEVWELLTRISHNDEDLSDLLSGAAEMKS